jgi:hypothetical protein
VDHAPLEEELGRKLPGLSSGCDEAKSAPQGARPTRAEVKGRARPQKPRTSGRQPADLGKAALESSSRAARQKRQPQGFPAQVPRGRLPGATKEVSPPAVYLSSRGHRSPGTALPAFRGLEWAEPRSKPAPETL